MKGQMSQCFHSYIHSLTRCHFHRDCREKLVSQLVLLFLLCHLVNLGSGIFYTNLNVIYLLSLHCTGKYPDSFSHVSHFSFLPNQRKESHSKFGPRYLGMSCWFLYPSTILSPWIHPWGCNSIECFTGVCLVGWCFCCNSPSLGVSFEWTENLQ